MSTQPSDGTKGPVAVTGIKPADKNKPPARLELRDLRRNNPKQWNLYLLGMERFQQESAKDESHPLSYFAIAGIHGAPFTRWPDRDWNKVGPANNFEIGYCTHSSIIFLTWHRPYLALFETELHRHVTAVANAFSDKEGKASYLEAAETFRLPYWDWARPNDKTDVTIFPWETMTSTVHKVIRPGSNNVPTNMDVNPLASYKFGKKGQDNDVINKFPKVNRTLRHPNREQTGVDETLYSRMIDFFKRSRDDHNLNKGKNLTERTLFVLQSYEQFAGMSFNRSPDMKGLWEHYGSLEDSHNAVHGAVGGDGHMGDQDTSAFDPIFWLHHCNIDRLFAIWQALHPSKSDNAYVTPQTGSRTGTWSIKEGAKVDKDTPLAPFTSSETIGKFWTSDQVRDTKVFGHVYPETQDWKFPNKAAILNELDRIYQQGSFGNFVLSSRAPDAAFNDNIAEFQARAAFQQQVSALSLTASTMVAAVQSDDPPAEEVTSSLASLSLDETRSFADLVQDNKYLEWLVDIRAEKHAHGGDFVVHVFLGIPSDDNPALYILDPSHVSLFSTFGRSQDTGCVKCQGDQAEGLQVTGQIPLTMALVERYVAGSLGGLDPDNVIPYLQQYLHWRVTTKGGQRIGRADINGLVVAVVTNEVTLPDDPSGFPSYAPNVVPRPAATTNRDGEARGKGTGLTE